MRLGWKTIVGGILAALGWFLQQPNLLDLTTIIQLVGMILAVFGVRHAIAKASQGR